MIKNRPKICLLTPTRITVHAFLKPHLVALAQEFDVTLAYNPANDAYAPPLDISVKVVAIDIKRKINPWSDIKALLELYLFFRREKFDLVVTLVPKAGLLGMLAAKAAGISRRVHIFQGEVWATKTGFMRALLKTTDRITVGASTNILAVGKGERRFLEEQGIAKPGQITVLGEGSISGVDCDKFKPDLEARKEFRKNRNIPDDAVICLFLGRLYAEKGVFELLDAFGQCAEESKKLWLIIVGPDEEGARSKLASRLTSSTTRRLLIEGYTDSPQTYLAAADFLCLPSYREGFAVSLLESAAVGIPAIGSDIYGISGALIEGETGLLTPPKNVTRLARAISLLANDQTLRQKFAQRGRDRVLAEFRQEQVVARYVDYFRQLLK